MGHGHRYQGHESGSTHWIVLLVVAVLLISLGGYFWLKLARESVNDPTAPPPIASPSTTEPPAIEYPADSIAVDDVDSIREDAKAPALEVASPLEFLGETFGTENFAAAIRSDDLIDRVVVTLDSLTSESLPQRLVPWRAPQGSLLVSDHDVAGQYRIASGNDERYALWLQAFLTTDPTAVLAVYKTSYTQFQAAYEALGYPDGYFNDRVVAVLDHLLDMPSDGAPPVLTRPNRLYLYADSNIEAGSIGHRLLLRLSMTTRQDVLARLAVYRERIAGDPPAG